MHLSGPQGPTQGQALCTVEFGDAMQHAWPTPGSVVWVAAERAGISPLGSLVFWRSSSGAASSALAQLELCPFNF